MPAEDQAIALYRFIHGRLYGSHHPSSEYSYVKQCVSPPMAPHYGFDLFALKRFISKLKFRGKWFTGLFAVNANRVRMHWLAAERKDEQTK